MIEIDSGVRRPWLGRMLRQGFNTSEATEITRRKKRNGGGVRNVRIDGQIPFLTMVATKGRTTAR
jgi:hypothetical protein